MNRANRVTGLLNGVNTNYVTAATYSAHGAPKEYQYGSTVWRDFSYNPRLQLGTLADTVSGQGSNTHLYQSWNWGTPNNNGDLLSASTSHGGPLYQQGFVSALITEWQALHAGACQ